jgi:pimeloyl-ACP methyl ester carboxylesterase
MNRRDALAGLAASAALPYLAACTSVTGAQPGNTHRMQKWAYSTEGYERIVHRVEGVETVVYAIGPKHGNAEPLVYFHGGGTFHGFEWSRALANEFRVYHPIHPNFGESGDAPFDEMGDYVSHYELLFPALGLDTFHLAGASMGGHMAARYAAANPGDIDKLVLVSAAGLKSERASLPDSRSRLRTFRRCSSPIRRGSSRTGPPTPRPNGRRCATANRARRSPRVRTSGRPTARCAKVSKASTGRRCCCGARTTASSRSAWRRTGRKFCRTPSSR